MTPPRAADGAVRVTLHPGEDVLLRPGARLADVRAPLAGLTRRPELRHATFVVDGERLTDDQVVGERPLLPGAVLRVRTPGGRTPGEQSPGGRTPGERTPGVPSCGSGPWPGPDSRWLVARVSGPDAGTTVGAESPWAALRAWAWLRGIRLRLSERLRLGGRLRPGRRPHPGERSHPGSRLRPAGRLTVRRTGGPAAWLAPRPEPVHGGVPWALTLLPAVASLGLAAALRQPLLAVFSLVGLVVALSQLRATRQRTAAGPGTRNRPHELPGPAGLLAFAHAALHVSPGAWAAAQDAWAAAPAARTAAPAPQPFGVPPGPGAALLRAPHDDPWEPLLHDGAVAVLGPEDLARAVARALVARLAARGAEVLAGSHAPGWSWVRWLPAGGPRVRVLDGAADGAPARAAGPWAGRPPGPAGSRTGHPTGPGTAVDLVVTVGTVPAGCRAVVRVLDARRVRITGPDGGARVVPLVGVTAEWAESLARLLAGAAWLGRTLGRTGTTGQPEDPPLSDAVSLTRAHGLAHVPGPADLAARWAGARGWAVPLGIGADGAPVHLDLVRDGPHLLVAGTTGSGKSELLQTLLLGLALTRSPADLALVLVDFKGGASLGGCRALPHVVGQVTDLEPGLAARALAGLRAELRRRERVLAEHGVPDVGVLPPGTLPRLVVVIDEFRALADDLPEFLPALLRVAAQGRSLGVHLVLATQRPGGAVGPDLRANVSARIALRVTDPMESRDVLDDPAAARIDAATPGRAVLRLGSAPPVPLQCAHVTGAPEAELPLVRRAPARTTPGTALGTALGTTLDAAFNTATARVPPAPTSPDVAAASVATLLVDAARRAASALGQVPGAPPWLPPLPRWATAADLPAVGRRHRNGLALALGDDPDGQRRTSVTWDPDEGHLAVLGRARSGRTTALVTLGLAALERGWAVHGIARDTLALARLRHHPGYGGTVHPADVEAVARVLSGAGPDRGHGTDPDAHTEAPTGTRTARADRDRTLVLVDGAEDARAALPPAALRSGPAFVLTADGPSVGGLASRVGPRLVLLGTDRAADVVLGAPAPLAGSGGPPGRAAWCGRGDPVLCQVLDPDDTAQGNQDGRHLRRRATAGAAEAAAGAGAAAGVSPRSRSPTSPP